MNIQTRETKILSNLGALQKGAAIAACLLGCVSAQASVLLQDISSLDTGAGLYSGNTLANAAVVDPNWTVSLLSSAGEPPGGYPAGSAYLVPNDIGFPFGYWLGNTSASSWITYSTPTQLGGDSTGGKYQYQLQFTAANSGTVNVTWLSDNDSWLYINGGKYSDYLAGSKPGPDMSTFSVWNTPISLSLTGGVTYTIDLDVYNEPQGVGNPTGGRVEFSAVPEPTTLISGALMLLPFGASTLRILRRNRAA